MLLDQIVRGPEVVNAAPPSEAPESPQETVAPPAEVQPTAEEPTGEQSEPIATVSSEGAPPSTESQIAGLKSAAIEARQKLQRTRQELEEFRRLVGERQAEQTKPKEPEPFGDNVFEDLPGTFRTVEQRNQLALKRHAYEQSYRMAKRFHADYDEVMAHYAEVVQLNPYIAKLVDDSPTPALDAYDAAKEHLTRKSQTPEAIEAKVRAEYAAKEKALEAELEKLRAQAAVGSLPTSLTSARGTGATTNGSAKSRASVLAEITARTPRR